MSASLFAWIASLVRGGRGDTLGEGERWVVVDCETTGLHPESDQLLSIAAVAINREGIDPADSFEIGLRPTHPSAHDNVLVHGIGKAAQLRGEAPTSALAQFCSFVNGAPIVAFHASFDRTFLSQAMAASRITAPSLWLDLAALAQAVCPDARAKSLDEWLELFRIPVARRHDAVSDALATAMLFLMLRSRVEPGRRHFKALYALARQGRWLAPVR